jgi:hypothetical protein
VQKTTTYRFLLLILILLVIQASHSFAQVDTTIRKQDIADTSLAAKNTKKYAHSPKKAAIFSAALPGLGQAFNKKWWKIPIVYAAIGTSTGFIVYNQHEYRKFKDAYINRLNGTETSSDFDNYSNDRLFKIQNDFHNWRDISILVTTGFYVLNILDAVVDAHFFRYDMGDDLSLEVSPRLNFVSPGFNICLRF